MGRQQALIDDSPFPEVGVYSCLEAPAPLLESGHSSKRVPVLKRRWVRAVLASALLTCGTLASLIRLNEQLHTAPKDRSPLLHRTLWSEDVFSYGEAEWAESFELFYNANKKYEDYPFGSQEFFRRFGVYKSNLKMIFAHNERIKSKIKAESKATKFAIDRYDDTTYSLAPNKFADLTFTEFQKRHLNTPELHDLALLSAPYPQAWDAQILSFVPEGTSNVSTLPKSVDWHSKGCVTPVKDQAKCGSCWAFSSTGAIEGALCAQTGELFSLSEQELVDCAGSEGEHGCNGGVMDRAFQYVIDNKGLCLEEEYPYTAAVGVCAREACKMKRRTQIQGYIRVPPENDRALRSAVAFYGPVAAGIEADRSAFQFYHDGVFTLPCGKKLNHAILVVGYGTDEATGQSYWLVKNSWGANWGDQGYVKLARKGHHGGKAGECGILLAAVTPIVAS